MLLAPWMTLEEVAPERIVKLRGGDGAVDAAAHEEVADIGVGLEQHRCGKEDVVNADDAFLVELDVVDERRSAVQREIQRVVQVVVQVRAGADDEIHQPALHEFHEAAAEARRGEGAGDRQPDRRVVLRQEHLVREDPAGFTQPGGVEGLKALVDQLPDVGAAPRPVVANGFSGQVAFLARRSRCAVGHGGDVLSRAGRMEAAGLSRPLGP